MTAKVVSTALFVCGLVLVAQTALGTGFPVTANIIQVEATSAGHTATFSEVFPVSSFSGTQSWTLPAPVTLSDNLGTIDVLTVNYKADPEVDLEFALTNSSLTDPVYYTVSTATILFDAVPNAEGAALASVTLTQGAGSPGGASIAGQFPGGKIYQARYSTNQFINTGTVFSNLDPSLSFAAPKLSDNVTDGWGDITPVSLGTTVHMMESEFRFILSAGDQASGTGIFVITPEPASLALMTLAGAVLIRRRGSR